MSIQTEITRIESAKTAIASAIEGKGVTVPDGTLLDGMAPLIESIEAGGVGVQPDWNQNDETAADYVKNRPFYTGEPVETVFVEESTTAFSDEGGLYGGEVTSTFSATVGNTYIVYWDGAVYESVCADYRAGLTAIGNLSIAGAGADTGEPFFIVPDGSSIYIYTADTSASHTFSISGFVPEVVKIDEKYLPKASENSYGIIKTSDVVSAYNFPLLAQHDQMVDAIAAFRTRNASIVWNGANVIHAKYNSSSDTISVVFANEPLKVLTYSNDNGFYNKTLGSPTYGELQGNQVRIINAEGVYTVLSTEGTPDGTTLCVGAGRISIGGSYYGVSKTEMILKSSTAGSTKNFRITVDDSGTITATEVS